MEQGPQDGDINASARYARNASFFTISFNKEMKHFLKWSIFHNFKHFSQFFTIFHHLIKKCWNMLHLSKCFIFHHLSPFISIFHHFLRKCFTVQMLKYALNASFFTIYHHLIKKWWNGKCWKMSHFSPFAVSSPFPGNGEICFICANGEICFIFHRFGSGAPFIKEMTSYFTIY